ncbi:hypothetical protein K1719_029646 [Acacia pycnantha]|nr:hypothetical protein K1719_029646 [Acacia pycnantha]
MSFLWLEFSQSFQVLAILFTTLVYSLVYGYRFWTAIGFRSACFPFVFNCQIVLLGCNLISHNVSGQKGEDGCCQWDGIQARIHLCFESKRRERIGYAEIETQLEDRGDIVEPIVQSVRSVRDFLPSSSYCISSKAVKNV